MHTLNLDFSSYLTSFEEDCFNCMPNLTCLSMCETRISNLWTTIAALSKLPSLVQLRFQYWQYCNDTGTSFTSSSGKSDATADFRQLDRVPFIGESRIDTTELTDLNISVEDPLRNVYSFDEVMSYDVQSMVEDSSDDSEIDLTNHHPRNWLSDVFPRWGLQMPPKSEVANLLFALKIYFLRSGCYIKTIMATLCHSFVEIFIMFVYFIIINLLLTTKT